MECPHTALGVPDPGEGAGTQPEAPCTVESVLVFTSVRLVRRRAWGGSLARVHGSKRTRPKETFLYCGCQNAEGMPE